MKLRFSMEDINENALLLCDHFEKLFDEHMTAYSETGSYEPLVLRDTEIMPEIIKNTNMVYPFLKPAELQYAIAILNAAVFRFENKLLMRGFVPSACQGVITAMTYHVTTGYWYRDEQHWASLEPIVTVDVDTRSLPAEDWSSQWSHHSTK